MVEDKTWIPATTKPTQRCRVNCRCGVTGEIFQAVWDDEYERFIINGEVIIFGNRDVQEEWQLIESNK